MAAAELVAVAVGDGPTRAPGELTLLPLEFELKINCVRRESFIEALIFCNIPIRGRRIGGQFQFAIGLFDRTQDVCHTERRRVQVVMIVMGRQLVVAVMVL